jgi:hypothetical protein
MTELKRYDMDFVSNEECPELNPVESDDGKWVKYEDVKQLLNELISESGLWRE